MNLRLATDLASVLALFAIAQAASKFKAVAILKPFAQTQTHPFDHVLRPSWCHVAFASPGGSQPNSLAGMMPGHLPKKHDTSWQAA